MPQIILDTIKRCNYIFFFFESNKDILLSFLQMMKPIVAPQKLGGTAEIKPLDVKAIERMSLTDK